MIDRLPDIRYIARLKIDETKLPVSVRQNHAPLLVCADILQDQTSLYFVLFVSALREFDIWDTHALTLVTDRVELIERVFNIPVSVRGTENRDTRIIVAFFLVRE